MAERVEDLNLPNAVVTRIIKECLPEGISVGKEARTAVARAASVFVLYLTSSANNAALQASRKTITANDVFKALHDTNFEFFIDPLKEALEGFKKQQQDKKQKMASLKKKDASDDAKKADLNNADERTDGEGMEMADEDEPAEEEMEDNQ